VKLSPGTLCYAGGATYEIDGRQSATHVTARDCVNGTMATLAIKDLREPPRPVATAPGVPVDALAWQRATRLAKDLTPWLGHQRIPTRSLAKLAASHCISTRQLQRLRVRFDLDPRTTSLLPGKVGRRDGKQMLAERIEKVIAHAIRRHYLQREQPTVAYLVDRLGALCRQIDVVAPTRRTVLARLRDHDSAEVDRSRLGAKSAKQRWEPRTGGLSVDRPMAVVQIDHTRVDVLIVSDDRQRVIGRPWITLAIDVYTRCVVGWYLTMEAPSSVSVALCVEHMVLPKPENEVDPGVWPMYGKPEVILVDNGKDFRAEALKTGCEQHGIELRWRPVKTPHYGAHIERLNGTLMRMVHQLKGTTFSNARQRNGYESEARATMTFAELKAWIVQSICRTYHVKAHRALGISPLLAWEQAWHAVDGKRRDVPQVARPLEFRLDFLPRAFRRIRRTGVEFGRSRYWHEDLAAFLRQREDAEIRYDPRDTSCIWVRAGRLGFIQARAIAGRAVGDTLADRRMTADDTRRMHELLDHGFAVRDAIEAHAAQQTRKERKGKKAPTRVERDPAVPAEPAVRVTAGPIPPPPRLALPAPEPALLPPAVVPATSPARDEVAQPAVEAPVIERIPPPPVPPRPTAVSPIAFEIWS
jgi:putative transposase